jgi:hypothetical protein
MRYIWHFKAFYEIYTKYLFDFGDTKAKEK